MVVLLLCGGGLLVGGDGPLVGEAVEDTQTQEGVAKDLQERVSIRDIEVGMACWRGGRSDGVIGIVMLPGRKGWLAGSRTLTPEADDILAREKSARRTRLGSGEVRGVQRRARVSSMAGNWPGDRGN